MKKARVLSTISTSLFAGLLAAPAAAQLPGAGECYTRSYETAHLAAHPRQGVQALRLWFYDHDLNDPGSRRVVVEARMAHQGQARGVEGQVVRSTLDCRDEAGEAACFVECDGGYFTTHPQLNGGLEIATERVLIGPVDACGGAADLSEGGMTRYRLAPAGVQVCADLAQAHPLPEPGCYGVAYPRADETGTVAALTLRLQEPDLDGMRPAFPWLVGALGLELAPGPSAAGDLAGARVMLPVWCGSDTGDCISGPEDAVLGFAASAGELVLTATRLTLYGEGDAPIDLLGDKAPRHVLVRLADEACSELELE